MQEQQLCLELSFLFGFSISLNCASVGYLCRQEAVNRVLMLLVSSLAAVVTSHGSIVVMLYM